MKPAKGVVTAARSIFSLLLVCAIMVVPAGKWDWVAGWVFLGFYIITVMILVVLLRKLDPELLEERNERREGIKQWDRWLVSLYSLFTLPAIMIVAGLNERFGWMPRVGLSLRIAVAIIGLAGWALAFWAIMSNTYFSTYVRIQSDRGHTVVSTGPYRFIRHPGYAGNIIFALTIPLFLGSVWALIPACCATIVIMIRTALEDRTLRLELEGYEEYSRRVRYRLIPGIW